MSTRLCLQLVV